MGDGYGHDKKRTHLLTVKSRLFCYVYSKKAILKKG